MSRARPDKRAWKITSFIFDYKIRRIIERIVFLSMQLKQSYHDFCALQMFPFWTKRKTAKIVSCCKHKEISID